MPAVVSEIASGSEPHAAALAEQIEMRAGGSQDLVPARASLSRRHLALALARALRDTSMSNDMLARVRARRASDESAVSR